MHLFTSQKIVINETPIRKLSLAKVLLAAFELPQRM
jgi:hypothetical protein